MEVAEVRSERRRGRKRKRVDVQNVEVDKDGKKRVLGTRSKAFLGRYVTKEFEENGVFLGKITSYDSGLYRVDYEDGDCEDLESSEVKEFLIEESDDINGEFLERKKKLDELVSSKDLKARGDFKVENVAPLESAPVVADDQGDLEVENLVLVEPAKLLMDDKVEVLAVRELSNHGGDNAAVEIQVNSDSNADSTSDSCEDDMEQDQGLEVEVAAVPRPELPPSSGNVGVPEEYVSHLFSVYRFLRSFSIQLFLSPFSLDDFVGSLKCTVSNTLVDSIHVGLMRSLRGYLEKLSSDGSQFASKCLRGVDWNLLDALTWPVYLVHYLMIMGYMHGPEWKSFLVHALERDYYSLPVGRKLVILQILCDGVLDSEELRAEIDMCEESEFGIDSETGTVVAHGNGPRRVHPKNSKTSACKEQEAREIIAQNHETMSFSFSTPLVSKVHGEDACSDVGKDGNGDECRLCGMDGTLLCCDGCPSSYHSRCIGVSKMFIPEGPWYCPECTINKIAPRILRGTTLKGAEILGVDMYDQAFVGACDHLLVLNASIKSDACLRYYNQNDIPNVLQALQSNTLHVSMYSEICNAIIQYWDIPGKIFCFSETSQIDEQSTKEEAKSTVPLPLPLLGSEGHGISERAESEYNLSCITGSSLRTMVPINASSKTMISVDRTGEHGNEEARREQPSPFMKSTMPGEIQVKSTVLSSLSAQLALSSDLTQNEKSVIPIAACTSRNIAGNSRELANGHCIVRKLAIPHEETKNGVGGGLYQNSANCFLYTGSSFKIQGYINNYLHGHFAASAAANLAVLSSEENQVSSSHTSDQRKLVSANLSLQAKAFSSVAVRFFWPHTEKKLIEVPRERCSWCFSCKAPGVSKRGCLLNAAASNAIKGALKILAGLRPLKSGEGTLSGIATYVMFMEESLSGLTIGPFQNAAFKRHWLKQVEQAKTWSVIKFFLLELEENIRTIALSGDWVKLVDGWSAESSVIQNATTAVGSTQKRRPGRRGRKPSVIAEVDGDDGQDTLTDFTWWRGGMLSKIVFQKGSLTRSLVKKAARQGGSRKIPGIYYAEGSETPKRSRRLVWRAAVEMSQNASQLALQVRYLDFHVRWNDFVRPEPSVQDPKGPETEASSFRSAYICDKKIVENEIRYSVAFGSQKHLPSRVMKNVTEVEQCQDGKEKYWFPEIRIPLYLIKEYEENAAKVLLPSSTSVNDLAMLQRRHSKASRKDILSYLARKRDIIENQNCAFCKLDILLGNGVKCSSCEGLYHEQCTISSTANINNEVEFLITCKQCYQTKTLIQIETSNESPTSPLLLRGQEFPNDLLVDKDERLAASSQSSASVDTLQYPSGMKPINSSKLAAKTKQKLRSWGLIWRKNNAEDTGTDFRLKNILLKRKMEVPCTDWCEPVCHLCRQPYDSGLMYIRCETCTNWYHAEAVELEESKICELVGFKCCRCRRIRSPECPYSQKDSKKKLNVKKIRIKGPKQEILERNPASDVVSQQVKVEMAKTTLTTEEKVVCAATHDPLIVTHPRVEQYNEFYQTADCQLNAGIVSGPGPQKLPVRRHNKREKDADHSLASDSSHLELSNVGVNPLNSAEESLPPHVEWGISTKGFDDAMMFDYEGLNYEDMEFEPQTYFSFNELLASDDGGTLDGVESSVNVAESWENLSLFPSDEVIDTSFHHQEPAISVEHAVNTGPCKMCSHTQPFPNLCCQICGIKMHSHCSPWHEESFRNECWRCGNCREWQ